MYVLLAESDVAIDFESYRIERTNSETNHFDCCRFFLILI
jgi:hypothetical protein